MTAKCLKGDMRMGGSPKYSRYRWKEGREKDLWSFVDGRVRDGASVTAALKEYGKKHNMSWLTARWKYYQIRKQGVQNLEAVAGENEPVVVPEGQQAAPEVQGQSGPFTKDEEDFLGYLAEFISSSRETGQDVIPFIKGLSRLAALSKEGTKLRQELERSRGRAAEGAQSIERARRFLEGWLKLSQVDRAGALKDFSSGLEIEVRKLAEAGERLANG